MNFVRNGSGECIEADGEEDHLHLLFRYAPQLQLSKFINNFKSVSSRKMRQEFDTELRSFYWDWGKGFWSDSYSIDSVGFAPSIRSQTITFITKAKRKLSALRETQEDTSAEVNSAP